MLFDIRSVLVNFGSNSIPQLIRHSKSIIAIALAVCALGGAGARELRHSELRATKKQLHKELAVESTQILLGKVAGEHTII